MHGPTAIFSVEVFARRQVLSMPAFVATPVIWFVLVALMSPDLARARPPDVCTEVATLANTGRLSKAVFQGEARRGETPDISDPVEGSPIVRGRLDINNDDLPENVYVVVQGTARVTSVVIYDARMRRIDPARSPEDDWDGDEDLRWALDMSVFRHRGQWYIVGASDDRLHYVSRIGPDNVERVVCRFQTAKVPNVRIVSGGNRRICRAAVRGTLDHVSFDRLHAVTRQDAVKEDWYQSHPENRAAMIDIDNDGQREIVVPLVLSSGGGRGCDQTTLRVLDTTRTSFARSPLATAVAEVGGGCRMSRVRPFVFEGTTYLEHKYHEESPGGPHAVYRIRAGRQEEVCRISATPVQRAVRPPRKLP